MYYMHYRPMCDSYVLTQADLWAVLHSKHAAHMHACVQLQVVRGVAQAHLMASDHEVKVIGFQERLCDVRTKLYPAATLAWCTTGLRLRVTPENVAHDSRVRRLPEALDLSDVVKSHPIFTE
jgi:hypothetical protein